MWVLLMLVRVKSWWLGRIQLLVQAIFEKYNLMFAALGHELLEHHHGEPAADHKDELQPTRHPPAIQVDCADDMPDLKIPFASLKDEVAILTTNSEKQICML